MGHRCFHRTLLCAVALSIFAPAPTSARQAAAGGLGAVQGVVFDSIAGGPLPDAAVFLFNTSHRAASDSEGRFRLDGIPPGRYSLVFYHERLGRMGISVGPTAIEVAADSVTQVSLATPSMFTVVTSQCLIEGSVAGTGILAGRVSDGASGTPIPGASVEISWLTEDNPKPYRLTFRTSPGGWYRACRVPAGVPMVVSASFLGRQALRREVLVQEGHTAEAALRVGDNQPSRVSGHLVDAESGDAVSNAEVWLRGTAFRAVTSPDGDFRFGDVPAGTYMMAAKHLQYGTKLDTLVVPSGRTLTVDMRVSSRAIEIAPLEVTVESGRPLTERAMGGLTIRRAQIDSLRGRVRDVADILRAVNVPGIIVRRDGGSLCIGYMQGQVRMMFRSNCVPMVVYIDNVLASNTDLAVQISPEAIDHVTIYKPVEAGNLFGLGSGNGVIAIFTRH